MPPIRYTFHVNRRSIGFPLAIGITLMVLSLLLAIGWQVLVVGDLGPVTRGLTTLHWIFLILGSAFFLLIIVGCCSCSCGWSERFD